MPSAAALRTHKGCHPCLQYMHAVTPTTTTTTQTHTGTVPLLPPSLQLPP